MKKSVSFYYTLVCAILTLATMLFVSCAGGTSSADGDVGYLTFGSSRAESEDMVPMGGGGAGTSNGIRLNAINRAAADLTSLTLKGTRNGKTTTLYTWSTYGEIPGTAVPVQAGSWTFVLSGEATPATGATSLLFTSEQDAVITAGEDTSVTFTMIYNGVSASEAQTGDIILTQGTNEIAVAPSAVTYFIGFAIEGVAMRASDGHVYGIKGDWMQGGYSAASTNYSGWDLPSRDLIGDIYGDNYTVINNALDSLGYNIPDSSFPSAKVWTSDSETSGKHFVYAPFTGNTIEESDTTTCYAIFVKQYN